MNVLDNKQAIVGCVFLVIGLILMFLVHDIVAWTAGAALIAFAPYGQYGRKSTKKAKKPYRSLDERKKDLDERKKNPDFKEKWCDITPEKFDAYTDSLSKACATDSGFVGYFCGSRSLSRIIWAVLAVLIGFSMATDASYQGGAIAFCSYFVLKLLANLYNGGEHIDRISCPPNFYANSEGAQCIFGTQYDESSFQIQPQVQMRNDNGEISLRDIRFNVVPKTRIPGILCAMIAMTVNHVRYSDYPYHYLVLVFKGTRVADTASIVSDLRKIAGDDSPKKRRSDDEDDYLDDEDESYSSGPTRFKLDVKTDDGNSIFVMTKSDKCSLAYATDNSDCAELLKVTKQTVDYLNKRSDKLKKLCS